MVRRLPITGGQLGKKQKKKDLGAESVTAAAAARRPTSSEKDDMDEIFGGLTAKKLEREELRKAKEAEAAEAAAEAEAARRREKKRRANVVRDNVFGEAYDLNATIDPQNAKVHRVDHESGWNVYKAHHLGLGRGGGTPLCPFDCKCCY
ncbi:hypothetical protein AB1Y20_017949 [Prymnesium parvum]|uniref:Pre-mRNA-splicing factor SLU7 n=1 Tax=Prymnesium parvum TaxID=97485 RepID=A0AB34JNE9_PRYPA